MGEKTYTTQVIVLRKTKLGESDLILTMLDTQGAQRRAVAKGARKPANSFASRLELYSLAEVHCSKGRNLDIIKEARLLDKNEKLRIDLEYSAGAASMVELLDKVTQLGLDNPKLFDMTRIAFSSLQKVDASQVASITAAHLLKTLAFSGLRPSLMVCVCCGTDVSSSGDQSLVPLSYQEGGILCENCISHMSSVLVNADIIKWANFLLTHPFDQIIEQDINTPTAFEILRFCQIWISEHVGVKLKSLNFMFTCGLYSSG